MEEKKIIAYKGFNEDLTCREFQYEVGKEYKEKGKIDVCVNGFHACENPFDVLRYYGNLVKNRFCIVEQSGEIQKVGDKTASSKIKILKELSAGELFKAGIEWMKNAINPAVIVEKAKAEIPGYVDLDTEVTSFTSNGDNIQIGIIGDFVKFISNGLFVRIGSSGHCADITSISDFAQIRTTGGFSSIVSRGNYAQIVSSGQSTTINSFANFGRIASDGDYSLITSSGASTKINSIGNYDTIASSGDNAQIILDGKHSKVTSNGDYASIHNTGENNVICCIGDDSKVKSKKGSWITLTEWSFSEEYGRFMPTCVKTEYVDGERIKEDVWYKLQDGDFVECLPE